MKAIIAFIVWTIVLAFMSLFPVYEASTYRFFHNEDKIAHVLMYFIMAYLLGLVLKESLLKGKKKWLWMSLILIPSLFGYLMEILQGAYIAGRQFDNFDIIANIIGSFAGTMLFYMLNTSRKGRL